MDLDPIILLGLAYLLMSGQAKKADAPSGSPPAPARETREAAEADGAALVRRAGSPRAAVWRSYFLGLGASEAIAEALSRWSGIESGGNPRAVSRLGERGLLQAMAGTALPSGMWTQDEWDSLVKPETKPEEHARLALQEFAWLWGRAQKHVADAPEEDADRVFYSKLWHQRPADFVAAKMRGPALAMAGELAKLWAGRALQMHYLRMASVVAWGEPEPWERMNV